jgi:hypothetical protein
MFDHINTQERLSALLCDWHRWSVGFAPVAAYGKAPMWEQTNPSRQWDAANDVLDASLHNSLMKSLDFEIDQLKIVHRTALQFQALNLSTGCNAWRSPRLPADPVMRAQILADARSLLLIRLGLAGFQ